MLRSTSIEHPQFGVEATSGTGVAADQQFAAITSFNLRGVETKTRYSGAGSETPNAESQEKVYSEFDGEAPVCYNLLPLFLNACLGNQAGSPYTWVPSNFGVDTLKTFTVEKGSAAGGEKAAYGVVKGCSFQFTKKEASFSFSGFARKLQPGITLTASPTKVACVPVDPLRVALLIGEDEGDLAAVNWQEVQVTLSDRWAPHIEGNATTDSFEEPNKVRNEHTIEVTFTASTAIVADLIAASRAKEKRCVRIKATSNVALAEEEYYDLEITAMCLVEMANTSEEGDDVVTASVTFVMSYDAEFGGFLKIVLKNAPDPED